MLDMRVQGTSSGTMPNKVSQEDPARSRRASATAVFAFAWSPCLIYGSLGSIVFSYSDTFVLSFDGTTFGNNHPEQRRGFSGLCVVDSGVSK